MSSICLSVSDFLFRRWKEEFQKPESRRELWFLETLKLTTTRWMFDSSWWKFTVPELCRGPHTGNTDYENRHIWNYSDHTHLDWPWTNLYRPQHRLVCLRLILTWIRTWTCIWTRLWPSYLSWRLWRRRLVRRGCSILSCPSLELSSIKKQRSLLIMWLISDITGNRKGQTLPPQVTSHAECRLADWCMAFTTLFACLTCSETWSSARVSLKTLHNVLLQFLLERHVSLKWCETRFKFRFSGLCTQTL